MKAHRVLVVIAAFLVLGILTVWQHVQMLDLGRDVQKLERCRSKLEQVNTDLHLKVKQLRSRDYLKRRAQELGLRVVEDETAMHAPRKGASDE